MKIKNLTFLFTCLIVSILNFYGQELLITKDGNAKSKIINRLEKSIPICCENGITHIPEWNTLTDEYFESYKKSQEENRKENFFSFAFITDTHITTYLGNLRDDELPVSRETLADVPFIGYERLLNEVKAKSVDFILTGGDNIDPMWCQLPPIDGKLFASEDTLVAMKRKYIENMTERIKKIDKSLAIPVYYTIGNHDIYGCPLAKSDDPLFGEGFFNKYFGFQGQPYYSFDKKGCHFIVLSTFDGNGFNVSVSNKQLEWLKNDLSKIDMTTPIILSSHVPFPIQKGCDEISKSTYEILKNYNVKLALFGHWHCYHEFMWHNIPCIIGSSASGAVWSLVRNVTDVSLGQINKGTNQGYLIVHVNGKDIEWNYYPFSYSIEQYLYEKTGKRCSISYSHSK